MLVGTDGKPKECRIVSTSFFRELDSGTCDLMMKMRFMPSRDEHGNAVLSRYSAHFNWRLTEPRKFESAYLLTRLSLRNGKVKDCTVTEGAGSYLTFWSSLVCTFLVDAKYYFGARQSGDAIVEFRLDAGDGADVLKKRWASENATARERITFAINEKGDASQCDATDQYGFGARGLNNLSPCGRLLSILWFESAPANTPRKGTFETRVSF